MVEGKARRVVRRDPGGPLPADCVGAADGRLAAGVAGWYEPVVVTTNAQGYRALADFHDDIKKYQVMIVGDSFTFGDGGTAG